MKRALMIVLSCLLAQFAASGQIAAVQTSKNAGAGEVKDIIIVFKMHFDIGYTDWSEAILQKYSTTMMDQTLNSIRETSSLPEGEQFVWTVPGWPVKYILENSTPDVRQEVTDALQSGRFAVHSLPFTIETESSDLETVTRGMRFSSDLCRLAGRPLPRDAKMTDVPSHSWVIPTILSNAGVKILHIGCNSGSASPDVPTVFWWEGPDGSRLLTFNWAEYYGSGVMPPADWPFKTWLAVIHTHENTGAPTPEEVAAVLAEAHEKAPDANIRIGRIEDFYDALMAENPHIPVVKGDMPDTWIHGYMSDPASVKTNKYLQRAIYQVQALDKSLDDMGLNTVDCNRYVNKAIEECLLFDEHTFGLALSHGHQAGWQYGDEFRISRAKGDYDFIEESWYEKSVHTHKAKHNVIPVLRRSMKLLADSVGLEGRRIVVYNQLPWKRSGEVSLPSEVYMKDFTACALKDAVTGEIIPVDDRGNIFTFYASSVPAMGYKTYSVLTDKEADMSVNKPSFYVDTLAGVLENTFFRVEIDKSNGSLRSVFDKKRKREIRDKDSDYGFGEYVHEMFGNDEIRRYNDSYVREGQHFWADREMCRPENESLTYSCRRGKVSRIRYDISDVAVSATAFCHIGDGSGMNTEEYMITYTLDGHSPYLKVNWYSDVFPSVPNPEGGWLAFPFDVRNPEFHLWRPGAVVNPAKDYIASTNHNYCFVNTGLAVTGRKGEGYGLNSPHAPGVSLGRPGLFRFEKDYVPDNSNVFVNLYNNQWGTNFTEWIREKSSATVYIWSIDDYDNESSLVTPVEETRSRMFAKYSDAKGGRLPVSADGIRVSERGILLTTYCDNPDGDGTLLRLWEQSGKDRECTVYLPEGVYSKGVSCNLRGERTGEEFDITGNRLDVSIRANAPLSVILY